MGSEHLHWIYRQSLLYIDQISLKSFKISQVETMKSGIFEYHMRWRLNSHGEHERNVERLRHVPIGQCCLPWHNTSFTSTSTSQKIDIYFSSIGCLKRQRSRSALLSSILSALLDPILPYCTPAFWVSSDGSLHFVALTDSSPFASISLQIPYNQHQFRPFFANMAYHDSPSPAIRPQLTGRISSAQSASQGSPSNGQALQSHKGSSNKLYKAHAAGHAVGHARHTHGRIPSYGKNMNKLSKLTSAHPGDGHASTKAHAMSTSPTASTLRRSISGSSIPRTGTKLSVKRNSSNLSQKRNGSLTKLGKPAKPQPPSHLRHDSSNELRPKANAKAKFSVGSQDEEWTEASSSQSPTTTRQSSLGPKPPQLEEPPSPDDPPARSPSNLPHSPPASPPTSENLTANSGTAGLREGRSTYSHSSYAGSVTNRLLSRHSSHNIIPTISSISATVTPLGSSGSPSFHHSHDSTLNNEPSMPADGISRFLNSTGSSSSSATPSSESHLQSTLDNIRRRQNWKRDRDTSPASPETNGHLEASNRAQSAGNLTHPRIASGSDYSGSPPQAPVPNHIRASPFESARDPRDAGKSMTQLKLDLQRMSTNREPAHAPAVQAPLAMMHGAHAITSVGEERSAERRVRQWEQAELEFRNGRRFHNMLTEGVGRSEKRIGKYKRGKSGQSEAPNADERNGLGPSPKSRPPSRSSSRGRVRFEIGRTDEDDEEHQEEDTDGVDGLLRRMWEGNEAVGSAE